MPASPRRKVAKKESQARPNGLRALLDTHVFLWALGEVNRLSEKARQAIEDPANEIYVSAAVVWEIAIKYALGKLQLPSEPATYIPARVGALGFRELPIRFEHALLAASLPRHHRDPFDRMLIAQARIEGMTFITDDQLVARYFVNFLPASVV